jgi:hypothetical protein
MVRSATPRRAAILLVFAVVAIAGPATSQTGSQAGPEAAVPVGTAPVGTAPVVAVPVVAAPILAVVDVTGRDDGRALARAVQAAIARQGTRRPVAEPVAVVLTGPRSNEDTAAVADAGRALALARDAVAHFDRVTAVRQVTAGVASLVTAAPTGETIGLLSELLFAEGIAHATDGDVTAATTAFAAVRRLDPARQIDPRTYLPDVVRAFTAAGRPLATAPLSVRVTGPGAAEIWVDGVPAGPAPQVIPVAVGTHLVSATGPDITTTGARVTVGAGAPTTVELAVEAAPVPVLAARWRRRLAAADDDASRSAALAGLATAVGASEVVMVVERGAGLGLRVWHRGARAPGPVHATDGEIPPGVLPGSVPPPSVVTTEGPGERRGERDDDDDRRWWQRRWVQASALGGALVIAAGVITAVVLADDGSVMIRNMPEVD